MWLKNHNSDPLRFIDSPLAPCYICACVHEPLNRRGPSIQSVDYYFDAALCRTVGPKKRTPRRKAEGVRSMREEARMTTEVQIRKSRSYLPHLRKVVACLAAGLGMSRREAQDTEEAVNEICASSIEAASDNAGGSLCIKLHTCENCMTVEISDPLCAFTPADGGQWLVGATSACTFQKVRRLADEVEFMPAPEGTTIRFIKYARETGNPAVVRSLHHLPTTTLHA